VSKERAKARAAREADAARRAAEAEEVRAREAAERARRDRRSLAWRRVRLWQHGSGFQRRKEAWAGLAALALVAILVAFFVTGSLQVVLLVVLVLIIGAPVLIMLTFDRRSR
jgi:Flp pilus assembly protein TadB